MKRQGFEQLDVHNENAFDRGWKGDWEAGERPSGYRLSTDRYQRLKREHGFSAGAAMGQDNLDRHNELVDRARSGCLDEEELNELLKYNKMLHEAMDKFEESL